MDKIVYYVTVSDRPGQVKIGISDDPISRARILGGINAVLLAVEPGGRTMERKRHAQFAAMRRDGEWFTYGAPIISHVMDLDQLPVSASVEAYRMPVGA